MKIDLNKNILKSTIKNTKNFLGIRPKKTTILEPMPQNLPKQEQPSARFMRDCKKQGEAFKQLKEIKQREQSLNERLKKL